MHTVYGVAERITVLNVQKARLRVLFALRLVSGITIFKSAGGVYLLRCCAKINPQRIKDTPAVNFCSRLVSVPPICKSAGFAEAAGMPLVISEAMFQHR